MLFQAIQAYKSYLAPLFHTLEETAVHVAISKHGGPVVMLTETLVIDGTNNTEIRRLCGQFGMTIIEEGCKGNLAACPGRGRDRYLAGFHVCASRV
jgi:hypothetical protein